MIVNSQNTKKYGFGKDCEGFYFLESSGFNIKFERIPSGSSTSLHYHKGMIQFFFVKSGVLSIETESEIHVLKTGEGIELKGSKKHRVHNAHKTVVEYLVAEKYQDDCDTYYV